MPFFIACITITPEISSQKSVRKQIRKTEAVLPVNTLSRLLTSPITLHQAIPDTKAGILKGLSSFLSAVTFNPLHTKPFEKLPKKCQLLPK